MESVQQIDFLKFTQIITDIKTKMRVHSGITRDFRKKLIDEYILRKNLKKGLILGCCGELLKGSPRT